MSVVIRTENLGKKYIIGHQKQGSYLTLRDSLSHAGREMWQAIRHPFSPNREKTDVEEFWALKDVDLEIKEGDRVGIIGRNGAGKSTLLKILSRITEPTTGRVSIKGRVASLLEVGTGFHPELTGRENIFLNGAILGMTRHEIRRKFDEIVAFAEVEKFLDTPVKRYSSGMYVRLAFAVAAHLEPEILLVDEVLAVGDAQFQKKCLGKMGEVSSEGRTVLFVSHNMLAIKKICDRSIFLNDGKIMSDGTSDSIIDSYRNSIKSGTVDNDLVSIKSRTGSGKLRFVRYAIENSSGKETGYGITGQECKVNLFCKCYENLNNVTFGIAIFDKEGVRLSSMTSLLLNKTFSVVSGPTKVVFSIPNLPLNQGHYSILVDANIDGVTLDRIEDTFILTVENGDFWKTGKLPALDNPILIPFNVEIRSA